MLNLFFPHLCCGCDRLLRDDSVVLCVHCRARLAVCFPKDLRKNAFSKRFYGRLRLETGYALLRFESSNLCRLLLHKLKYQGKQQLGELFGLWMAGLINESAKPPSYDGILPVPLHRSRLRSRGYNQVDKFAQALGAELGIPVYCHALVRKDRKRSSVKLSRRHRFENHHQFQMNPKFQPIKGSHLLIVDDTVTTGATLEACAKVLLKASKIKISFATIAMTE